MFVWFSLHFEREHAKNMRFFRGVSLFLWLQPRIQKCMFFACSLSNACQSSSISEISTFLAGKVWKTSGKMHVFCMFVWFYLHFEKEHAKNMHFFAVFPCFCSSNLEFKNACFLHVQNACQSRSPAPFLEISTFLAGKVWKTSNKCMFFPCLHDFTCTMHFFEFFPRFWWFVS